MQIKYVVRIKLWIEKFLWNKLSILHITLLPVEFIFKIIVIIRRWLYLNNIISRVCFPVPVIVVGNITVGGNGKTPFVEWLAIYLIKKGFNPGIVSRGYGGNSESYPVLLTKDIDVKITGEEAILLHRMTDCPIVVDPNRSRAVKFLLEENDCNIVISDDGLQHYAMDREIEIVLIDNKRKLGNGYCLPIGPLREPISRIKDNLIVNTNKDEIDDDELCMSIKPKRLINIANDSKMTLSSLKNKNVTLVTSIADPSRIKKIIDRYAKSVNHIIFPDHYIFTDKDFLSFKDDFLVMTLKDAIKCENLIGANSWYIEYKVNVSKKLQSTILGLLKSKKHK